MKKNFPCIRIERKRDKEQFYLDGVPIHFERLFIRLKENVPKQLSVKVYKNEKLSWEGHYFIKKESDLEKYIWRAYECRF